MSVYKYWESAFRACNQEDREKSKAYWLKYHEESVKRGEPDLIGFSAQILEHIAIVEKEGSVK